MADEPPSSDSLLAYLGCAYVGYATAREIWSALKMGIVVGVIAVGVFGVLFYGIDWAAAFLSVPRNLGLPTWASSAGAFAFVLWMGRGRTFTLPKVTFKEWLFASVGLLVSFFLLDHLEADWPLALGLVGLMSGILYVLETANEHGKANFDRLKKPDGVPPRPAELLKSSVRAQVRELLTDGETIEAIRVIRAETGMSLAEARNYAKQLTMESE